MPRRRPQWVICGRRPDLWTGTPADLGRRCYPRKTWRYAAGGSDNTVGVMTQHRCRTEPATTRDRLDGVRRLPRGVTGQIERAGRLATGSASSGLRPKPTREDPLAHRGSRGHRCPGMLAVQFGGDLVKERREPRGLLSPRGNDRRIALVPGTVRWHDHARRCL